VTFSLVHPNVTSLELKSITTIKMRAWSNSKDTTLIFRRRQNYDILLNGQSVVKSFASNWSI